jgi:hypothetical protein
MNSFGSFRTSFSLHEANKRKAPDATTRRGSNRNIFSKMEFAFRLDLEGLKREPGSNRRSQACEFTVEFDVFLFCGHRLVFIFCHGPFFESPLISNCLRTRYLCRGSFKNFDICLNSALVAT